MTMLDMLWTRRTWLAAHGVQLAALTRRRLHSTGLAFGVGGSSGAAPAAYAAHTAQEELLDSDTLEALTRRAVEAATAAGADYADARFTRTVRQSFDLTAKTEGVRFGIEVGLGVRVLFHGYWGFASSYVWTPEEAVRLAQAALGQAKISARGLARPVELGSVPVVSGRWTTPIRIDPFRDISLEEKLDTFNYWKVCAVQAGTQFIWNGASSVLRLKREERVLATSVGSVTHQTVYETGGFFDVQVLGGNGYANMFGAGAKVHIRGIEYAGRGWELFLEAKIPEQFAPGREEALQLLRLGGTPAPTGRYTLVCDGATMAALVNETLGVATQLDLALGYEANAGGTSFLDDPLAMLGTLAVTAPGITITANRSAPAQLATVKWDDEAVSPPESTLIKDGVLTDFQTTREQAAWLAPYYQKVGRPVQSNGCAAAENAHYLTMQHPPNLAMAPNPNNVGLADLVATVKEGILIERGDVGQVDAQARNGLLGGLMRRIRNGRLGTNCGGAVVMFNTKDLWKHVTAVGGATTTGMAAFPMPDRWPGAPGKGEPFQMLGSHTATAAAAIITNQPIANAAAKA